jgi:hypothetical protein
VGVLKEGWCLTFGGIYAPKLVKISEPYVLVRGDGVKFQISGYITRDHVFIVFFQVLLVKVVIL